MRWQHNEWAGWQVQHCIWQAEQKRRSYCFYIAATFWVSTGGWDISSSCRFPIWGMAHKFFELCQLRGSLSFQKLGFYFYFYFFYSLVYYISSVWGFDPWILLWYLYMAFYFVSYTHCVMLWIKKCLHMMTALVSTWSSSRESLVATSSSEVAR